MIENKQMQFTISRPDGTKVIILAISSIGGSITIGKVVIQDGLLMLKCCNDIYNPDQGSVIPPWNTVVGDISLELK